MGQAGAGTDKMSGLQCPERSTAQKAGLQPGHAPDAG